MRKVVNMNYPEDTPPETVKRFWGDPRKEDRNFLDKIKVKKRKRRNEPTPL